MSVSPSPKPAGLKFKLAVMMFLQFFIWGAWFELGFSYIPSLKFTSGENGWIFGAFNIGALVALFFSTQLADRKFAAEKFLAFSHLIGGLAILGLFFLQAKVGSDIGNVSSAQIVEKGASPDMAIGKLADGTTVNLKIADGVKFWESFKPESKPTMNFIVEENGKAGITGDATKSLAPFWPFFLLMLLHSVFYVPTVSITNSIALNALSDASKEFGPIRLWGTIGWIAASWPFIFLLVDWAIVNKSPAAQGGFTNWLGVALSSSSSLSGATLLDGQKLIFAVAGVASLILAVFSLTLPHTPPKPAVEGEESLAWLKAMKLLKNPFVLVLFVVTFIDAAVHQSFFYWTFDFLTSKEVGIPQSWAGPVMKIGQIAEVLTMLALGYVLKNLGWRWTMIIGVLGHAARFAVFSFFPEQNTVILINVLHGVCYAFFFATVYIFVDEYFPKDVRSSAQGLFNVLILGVGPFVANFVCGILKDKYTTGDKIQYASVFQYSMFASLIGVIILLLFFHPKKGPSAENISH